MKKSIMFVMGTLLTGVLFFGAGWTALDRNQDAWKTGLPGLVDKLNANFNLAVPNTGGTLTNATLKGAVTVISTNGATTNVIVTVDGVVDMAKVSGTGTGLTLANTTFSGSVTGLSLVTNIAPTVTGGTFTDPTNQYPVTTGGTTTGGTNAAARFTGAAVNTGTINSTDAGLLQISTLNAMVGDSATLVYFVQTTNITGDASHTSYTNTWPKAFAAGTTPFVFLANPEAGITWSGTSSASNSCVVAVTANKSFSLVGIGILAR